MSRCGARSTPCWRSAPTVILGGGGYNPWTGCRYWAGMWGRITGQAMPERCRRTRVELLRGMECDLIDDEDVDDAWLTTMADSRMPGPFARDKIAGRGGAA